MNNIFLLKLNIILIYFVVNIFAEDVVQEPYLINSVYCSQFNETKLHYDPTKLNSLVNNQYILDKNVFAQYPTTELDYYIRYLLVSKGLCYNKGDIPDFNKIENIKVPIPVVVNNQQTTVDYVSNMRYAKTVGCYLTYLDYLNEEEKADFVNKYKLCSSHCWTYAYLVYGILYDPNLCPYPNFNEDVVPNGITTNGGIDQLKNEYIQSIYNICNDVNEMYVTKDQNYCKKLNNLEITNCGYASEEDKMAFKDAQNPYPDSQNLGHLYNKDCMGYHYLSPNQSKTYIQGYKTYKEAMIAGGVTGGILLLSGVYFSLKYIKEIKVQESIKKSILNQEKEYQEANKQIMKNAYANGFNPNEQVYNSSSRNLNNGTMRKARPMESFNTMNTSSSFNTSINAGYNNTNGRSNKATQGRYPPNSFTVSQDYHSSDERDISLRRGMIVQLIQRYEGGWVLVRDPKVNRQGYAPEYCLGSKMS